MLETELLIYQKLRTLVSSWQASLVAFLWGFFEATLFFIVPDVFFCFTAVFSPRHGIRHSIISILGSMPGGIIMYKLAQGHPLALNNFLTNIPGISERMVSVVHSDFQHFGLSALFLAPWKGIPYKIFAAQAGILNISLIRFVIATFPARLERMFLLVCLAAAVGKIFEKNIQKHTKAWIVFYIFLWFSFYYAYAFFLRIR